MFIDAEGCGVADLKFKYEGLLDDSKRVDARINIT